MLWNKNNQYIEFPFKKESELEESINEIKEALFGQDRIYLDDKRKIGEKGKTNNLPDGYLIDLSNNKSPKIFVVENELSYHQHLKHIAVQILEFSLSFDSSKIKVKNIIKKMLQNRATEWKKCNNYAQKNGYENVDYLLESIIQKKDAFNALLIIDNLNEELETVLISKFNFPVEVITLNRYKNRRGNILFEFEPFLHNIQNDTTKINISDIDTIIVPAREDGFNEEFLKNNCWYAVRINSSMIPMIKYVAGYQVSPISAITHIAEIESIKQWNDSNKYIIYFKGRAKKINRVGLGVRKGTAPQSLRYSSMNRIRKANTLDDLF